jgi:exonuclease III
MNKRTNKNIPINIMSLNCGGLTPLTETQIRNTIVTEKIHITLLQETKRKLTTETQIQTYKQAGHNIIALTHPNGQHGLQIWINKQLSATMLPQYSKYNNHIEYLTIRLHYLIIVNIYRKHVTITTALNELDELLYNIKTKYPNDTIILAGDFNATITDSNTKVLSKHKQFTHWYKNSNLTQISSNLPTRQDPSTLQQTAIDHMFIHPQSHKVEEMYLLPFQHISSDHRPIILSIQPKAKQTIIWRPKFHWTKYYNKILNDIKHQHEPTIISIQNAFLKYQRLHRQVQHHITIPRHWYKPSKHIKQLLKKAKTEKKKKDPNYVSTQKTLRIAIRKDKKQQYRSFLSNTKTEPNVKQFYTNLRTLKYPKQWNSDIAQGQEEQLLQILNHDDHDTPTKISQLNEELLQYYNNSPNTFEPFTINDLIHVLQKLPNKKSPGWDGIPYEFWQRLPLPIKRHLLTDINRILSTGSIPRNLSHTLIKPIQKSPTNPDPRPISLLPTITKIIEKLLKSRFQNWLSEQNKLAPEQFAFRPGHSSSTQIHRLVNNIQHHKTQNKKIALLSLDLSKAFDRVDTKLLIHQLIRDDAPKYIVQWMEKTLIKRPIQVISTTRISTTSHTSTGVLQGGTLAPLQFTYYINTVLQKPIPNAHSLYAFADDLAILCVADTPTQLEKLTQKSLNIILHRLESLSCTVSLPKTKLMTFNCKIPYLTYRNHHIHHVKQHRILGLLLDKTLTFHNHVQHILKKANHAYSWLKSIASTFYINQRKTLALQYVLSHLDYSLLTIYPFLSATNKQKLNTIISKTARFILQVPHSIPSPYAILEAQLQNIQDRATYLAIKHTRAHIHHSNPLCTAIAHTYQTRSLLATLDPNIDILQQPIKTILAQLRNLQIQQLSYSKPELATYISYPQTKLTHTTSIMTRLRTGHARTHQWLQRMKLIPLPPADYAGWNPKL